jgi:hypothetical protein
MVASRRPGPGAELIWSVPLQFPSSRTAAAPCNVSNFPHDALSLPHGSVAASDSDKRLAPTDRGARKLDEWREALELAIGRLPANH